MTSAPSAPPGWYPDPDRGGQVRYWNGSEWVAPFSGDGNDIPPPPIPEVTSPGGGRPPVNARWWWPLLVLGVIGLAILGWQAFNAFEKSQATLDGSAIADQIKSTEALKGITLKNVDCPEAPSAAVGTTFHCSVDMDGTTALLAVHVDDADGTISWELSGG